MIGIIKEGGSSSLSHFQSIVEGMCVLLFDAELYNLHGTTDSPLYVHDSHPPIIHNRTPNGCSIPSDFIQWHRVKSHFPV